MTIAPVLISVLPVAVNLKLYQGDTFKVDLTVANPDGSPADLTGQTAAAVIRLTIGAPDPPAATFTTTVDVAASVVHLLLPNIEAAKLTPGVSYWDCQIESTETYTLAAGKVTVTGQVTTT